MNRIEISVQNMDAPSWLDRFEAFALKVLSCEGHDNWDLSVLLCDDTTIHELNAQYRGKDEPTDVLSFELGDEVDDEEAGTRFLAGDIVISLDTLAKNAEYFNVSQDEELRRLVTHGILHLGGMDHEDNDPSQPMLVHQEEILKTLSEEHILS